MVEKKIGGSYELEIGSNEPLSGGGGFSLKK